MRKVDDPSFTSDGQNMEDPEPGVGKGTQSGTPARKAEQANWEELAALVGLSEDAILQLSLDGTVLSWNAGAERLYGYKAEELAGAPLTALAPDEAQLELKRILRQVANGATIRDYKTRRRHKDGRILDVSLSLAPISGKGGGVAGAVAVERDISERTRLLLSEQTARTEAEAAGRRFRALVENAADLVIVVDAGGKVRYASPAVGRILGYQPDSYPEANVFAFIHPADAARVQHSFTAALHAPGVHPWIEFRVRHADGTWRIVEAATNVRFDDPSVRGAVINLRDITARRQAEARLRFLAEASRVLAESLDYQATLARLARLAIPTLADWCGVHVLEADGEIQRMGLAHVDPAKEALLQDLGHRYPVLLSSTHPVAVVLRNGEPFFSPEATDTLLEAIAPDTEHRLLLNDLRIESFLCVPLVARGRILGAMACILAGADRRYDADDLALAEDLARRAALAVDNARLYGEEQEALRQREAALSEARAALDLRDQFLGLAAHELRTPLTSLKGYIQVIERRQRQKSNEGVGEFAARAAAQVDRLVDLVQDLLDVSRITAGRFAIQPEAMDLRVVARHVVELEQAIAPNRRIVLDLPDWCPEIQADAERLEQVLTNLIENALKYSPGGTPVRIRLAFDGETASLSVQDEGIGIPAGDLEHIFDRFHRAGNVNVRQVAGLGLGLHIVREIVEAHGGMVQVESELGHGSTFTVILPGSPP